jgi:hypothetical protein
MTKSLSMPLGLDIPIFMYALLGAEFREKSGQICSPKKAKNLEPLFTHLLLVADDTVKHAHKHV